MRRKKIIAGTSGVLLALASLFFAPARAATFRLYFMPATSVSTGQEFAVRMLLDSDQPVNAYSIVATYDPSALTFVAADNGHSIIDIWQGTPVVSQTGSIAFKGGSLKPFTGAGGELITLRFRALHAGTAELGFVKSSVYLSNGKGTKVLPDTQTLQLTVSDRANTVPQSAPDTVPPQITFLSLSSDPFNPSQNFLAFSAVDPGSGVRNASYRYREWFFWSGEMQAVNPAAVPRDAWSVDLRVYDNSGNVAEKTIYSWPAFFAGPFLLVTSIIAAMFVMRRLLRRR